MAGKNDLLSLLDEVVTVPAHDAVTDLLEATGKGDAQATNELVTLVYGELRRMASQQMAQEAPGQTLQPTALVHEAYARLVGADIKWQSRGHFFAAAARAMRQILVNRAHQRQAIKRGGKWQRVELADIERIAEEPRPEIIIALDRAIERLDSVDHRKAQIVMLRYFSGLTIKETARALGISPTTVKDDWVFARTWLYREMTRDE